MVAFIVKRLFAGAGVLLSVAFVAFVIFQYVGDPVSQMLGPDATESDRVSLRVALGLDKPAITQFSQFVGNMLKGELGISLKQGRPVTALIAERAPATLELSAVAAALAIAGGLVLGVLSAIRPESITSRVIMAASLVGASLPTFLIGILLILAFAVTAGWLPSYGRGQTVALGWWNTGLLTIDGWKHLVLPSVSLAVFQLALIVRMTRAEMMEVMRSDFIKFARARGIAENRIRYVHALRNALVPVITIIGLQIGSIVAFALVTETVFQWPGLGALFIESVGFADIPVVAAYLCLVAILYVTINLIVDILYFVIDPRLKAS